MVQITDLSEVDPQTVTATNHSSWQQVEDAKKGPAVVDQLSPFSAEPAGTAAFLRGTPQLEKPLSGASHAHEILTTLVGTNPENDKTIQTHHDSSRLDHVQQVASIQQRSEEMYTKAKTLVSASEATTTETFRDGPLNAMILKFLKVQQEFEEELAELIFDNVNLLKGQQKEIDETRFNVKERLHQRETTSYWLGWVNSGAVLSLIATTAASFFCLGPLGLLTFARNALAVTQGAGAIAQALINHKDDQDSAELSLTAEEKKALHRLMQEKIEQIAQVMDDIQKFTKIAHQIVQKRREAVRFY